MIPNEKNKKPVYAGLSVTRRAIELAVYSPKSGTIDQAFSFPVPVGMLDIEGDCVVNPALLKDVISQVVKSIKPRPAVLHLSLPGTLLRIVEMPRMDSSALYLSLSSEAERYKMFDNTEAVVDFFPIEKLHGEKTTQQRQQLLFGALRYDTLNSYLKILKELRVKVASISLEPLNVLRALAGTGVLDGLVQQVGPNAHWGLILIEPLRVRLSLWEGNQLVELRETSMDTASFGKATPDFILVDDMVEEIRRTTKNLQPTIWLTHEMAHPMSEILSSRLGLLFREAPIGNIMMVQPLEISTVGCTLTSLVNFPAEFNIQAGLGQAGKSHGQAADSAKAESYSASAGDEKSNMLIPAGIAAFFLCALATGALFLLALMEGSKLPPLRDKKDSVQMEVSALQAREIELKKKVALDESLLTLVKEAKIRNQVYVSLTDDLKKKTPLQLWIQSMSVDDGLEIIGKGLNHNSVIHFAQSFDEAPYTKAVLIDSIKEGKLNGTLIYDFKISGGINLNPALLQDEDAPKADASPNPDQTKAKAGA